MKKLECGAIEHAIADLEALLEFALIEDRHKPKLEMAIERLRELVAGYKKNHGRK